MPVCQSGMDDVFGWVSRNDGFGSLSAHVSSPPVETEREREKHGMAALDCSTISPKSTNTDASRIRRKKKSDRLKMRAHQWPPALHSGLKGQEQLQRLTSDASTLWLWSCASRGKRLSLFPPTAQFGFVRVRFPSRFSGSGTSYIPLKVFTFHLLPMAYYFSAPHRSPPNVQGE